ncbi:ABC transporter ATP-binding protein [Thalassobaculum sp. OXR-137]|uniref:ABC transporter ATP-binding protein n=1 Tax=Thalassobaculum sp. OXR-137 TaxID=3100173 RepID=UPI002AC955A1|nr:ABC transporter ATP-binding protein [Thalassobaculum sp. OXR-137]WPZ36841.1 ABC transporter ATP-binding protein [Thalassobaculum sp. OXR-137]
MFRRFNSLIDPFASDRLDQPPTGLFAFYWHYVRQVWPWFAALTVTCGLLSMIGASLFAYVGEIIDLIGRAETPASFLQDNLGLLIWVGFLVLIAEPLLAIVHMAIGNQALAPPFSGLIRWQTHRYLLRQSVAFFHNDFAGRIAQKVMQTSLALRRSVGELIDAIWYVAMFWISALVILLTFDPLTAIPLALWLAVYVGALVYFVPRVQRRATVSSESSSRLTGRLVDSYTNIQTVKLFGHARREDEYARVGIADQRDKFAELMIEISWFRTSISVLNGVLLVGHGALVLWLWSRGDLSVGSVAGSLGLIMRVTTMSHWIMFVAAEIAENVGVVREGADTIARPRTVTDPAGAPPLRVSEAEIRFETVSFGYGSALPVLHDLTLTVRPGEKVGLVGRSGAGKSTMMHLLLRFYDLQGGRILIDGQDITQVEQESLRAAIGVVSQDTSLLHRSIRDNIRYGRPEAGEAEVVEAARRAHAHDFIQELEDNAGRRAYDAQVGERGVKLSGGQRQRIAIARALLKRAPILVLDEATSALDSEVEAAIQEQLFDLMAGRTVIAIAHRLSTIAAMDRLVIMDGGRIVEQGTHRELLEKGGLYADLWARQSSGFIAD